MTTKDKLRFRQTLDRLYLIFQEIPIVKGSRIAESWKAPPIKPLLKIYFFNITNPVTFQNPKLNVKPVLEEVGPYVYEYVESLNNIITITLYNKMANWNASSNIISKMF